MHIHLEPVTYVGRGYAQPGGYEARRPYDLVFSVFMLGDGRARLYAAHAERGELDRATCKQICKALAEKGVHTLLVERHGVEQQWSTGLEIPVKSEKRE
jgi:hypothetical protein